MLGLFYYAEFRRSISPKRRVFSELQGTTNRKIVVFIVTAVRTSNPANLILGVLSEHLQFVTTRNFNGVANSHTVQFTTGCHKYSHSTVFTSRCLVMDPLHPCSRSYWLPAVPQIPPTLLTAVSRFSPMAIGLRYIVLARTAQGTPLPTVLLLLHCLAIALTA